MFGFLSLDILAVVNVQCTMQYSFHGKFVTRCCLPLVLLGLIRILAWGFAHRAPSSAKVLRGVFDAADTDGGGTLDKEVRWGSK